MAKYRVGDRVYPINCEDFDHLQDLYLDDDFDRFDFVGIVTEVTRYGDYSVAWLNRDRTEELTQRMCQHITTIHLGDRISQTFIEIRELTYN